ncbi:MAG: hypothetical protein WEB79_04220 [Thermoleophilaceae bacterium]
MIGGPSSRRRLVRWCGAGALALAVLAVGPGAGWSEPRPVASPTPAGSDRQARDDRAESRNLTGVSVADTGGGKARPCPAVRPGAKPGTFAGGCMATAAGSGVLLTVNTLAGRMLFARCDVTYTMRVDRHGRTALVGLRFSGDPVCADARTCFEGARVSTPRGRIAAAAEGRLLHVVELCLDTCIGRFAGEMRTALTPDGAGWREEARHSLVGTSGWEIDGSWRLEGDALRIVSRHDRPAVGNADIY